MANIPVTYRRFYSQLLHVLALPAFFFVFILIYRPFNIVKLLGTELFGVHITIITTIILVSLMVTRVIYYFLPLKLNYSLYSVWCLAEIIFTSFFSALYLWLVLHKPMPYFDVLAHSFRFIILSLIFPYVILALALRIAEYHRVDQLPTEDEKQRMRFYDEKHNLKIVLQSHSVLYIQAETNYVNINYLENDKPRTYMLRSSMKAIDELCQDHGLIRCQRSFYVNPLHVKVLRKEKDGVMYAELDAPDVQNIPVTKRYYEILAERLY